MYNPTTDYNMTDLERLQAMYGEFKKKNVYTVIIRKTTGEVKKFYFENREEVDKFLIVFYGTREDRAKRGVEMALACDETGHIFWEAHPGNWIY